MTINLNRRHFLSASALAAGFASLPASLRAAQTGPLAWGPDTPGTLTEIKE